MLLCAFFFCARWVPLYAGCPHAADQMRPSQVWASKWNERAFFSCRKARINHDDLSMAVLCQQVIRADYAYVIHTTNPATGDEAEIYAEVVRGLGETLVGAYPGRALSFAALKTDLRPRVRRTTGGPAMARRTDRPPLGAPGRQSSVLCLRASRDGPLDAACVSL